MRERYKAALHSVTAYASPPHLARSKKHFSLIQVLIVILLLSFAYIRFFFFFDFMYFGPSLKCHLTIYYIVYHRDLRVSDHTNCEYDYI